MTKISKIGSSNLLTNSTKNFGSMAGLAPTSTVRPHITSLPGYKYAILLNEENHYTKGCGYGKTPDQGLACMRSLGIDKKTNVAFRVGGKYLA